MYVALNRKEAAEYYEDNPSCTVKCVKGDETLITGGYGEAYSFFKEPKAEIPVKTESPAFRLKAQQLVEWLVYRNVCWEEYSDEDKKEIQEFLGDSDAAEFAPDFAEYSALRKILKRAFNQAADGKGKERHADGKAFEEQPIIRIQELVGSGFCLGQAIKKIQESIRLETPQASMELLGAINYIAAVIFFRERQYTKED